MNHLLILQATRSPGSHSPSLGLRTPDYLIPLWSSDGRLKMIAKVSGTESLCQRTGKGARFTRHYLHPFFCRQEMVPNHRQGESVFKRFV